MSDTKGGASPAELAAQIDFSLKSLLVHVGQSLRARSRLQSTIRLLQEKAASSTLQSKEELILLQQYKRGQTIPGLRSLEKECIRYDTLVKELAAWVNSAKEALEVELAKAKTREEAERAERERQAFKTQQEDIEKEDKRLAEERVRIEEKKDTEGAKSTESIVIDDDEDEDDVPLASRLTTAEPAQAKAAIDLTDDSPAVPQGSTFPSLTSTMTTSLLASLTGLQNTGDNTTSMALDNFDFSQLGLQQMVPDLASAPQANDFQTDSNSLDFNMDFLDYSAMGGGDGSDDNSNLFGNIDFSALLAGNTETKKEP